MTIWSHIRLGYKAGWVDLSARTNVDRNLESGSAPRTLMAL
jgi:hypothetical protein